MTSPDAAVHDSLENLHKVREIQASSGIQLRSNISKDETQPIADASRKTEGTVVSSKALQAYREMRHLNQREPIYHAYQLMSHPVSTVQMEMDILAARQYFQAQGFQQMPVISAQQRIVGMLSVTDLLQFIIICRWLPGKLPAWQACKGCDVARDNYGRSSIGLMSTEFSPNFSTKK